MAHLFKKFIQKDQLKSYPLQSFDGEISFFHALNQEERKNVLRDLGSQKVLGIDTETKPSFTKGVQNPLALLQIYLPHRVILFQLRKYSLPIEICKILENANITKVGVGLSDDIRGLRRDYNCETIGILDLNHFAKKKKFQSVGVQKLSALVLGIYVDKKQQLSNWERNPLSREQQLYAATDAWVSYAIYEKIKDL